MLFKAFNNNVLGNFESSQHFMNCSVLYGINSIENAIVDY